MIKRNYINGEQLIVAYNEVFKQGIRPYIVARRFGLSTASIIRSLDELQSMLAGKPLIRQKNRIAFEYAYKQLSPKRKLKQFTSSTVLPTQNYSASAMTDGNMPSDPYEQLNAALIILNRAIEELVIYEVERQSGDIKKELEIYKELAVKSNVTATLKKHFAGKL
jgi:hypothetical protein